jgi:hypothetical protein
MNVTNVLATISRRKWTMECRHLICDELCNNRGDGEGTKTTVGVWDVYASRHKSNTRSSVKTQS